MPQLKRWALAAALVLAACAAPEPQTGYRTGPGQIGSAVLFDPARFAGDWRVAASYVPQDALCGPLGQAWAPAPGGFAVSQMLCRPEGLRSFAGPARLTGPGRMEVEGPDGPEVVWVLWTDDDYRVAAIGTPDGRFGRVLVRPGAARADLIQAATEVLIFNGYQRGAIRPVPMS